MKGIILAGGYGTRLHPLTRGTSKQLLPLYDKPMIYYPLSILMLAGIREILVISTAGYLAAFERLLGDGKQWGLQFEYAEQSEPRGLADAFLVRKKFSDGKPTCLILGDNILYGARLPEILRAATKLNRGAMIFAYPVRDPERYAVVEFDDYGEVKSIEEKPENPRSQFAVTGIYLFDGRASEFAETLEPSPRGELEITDLIRRYLELGELRVELLGRGIAWLDAGTNDSLMQASSFIQAVQQRQGLMIACPEEIAYRMDYIDSRQLDRLASQMGDNEYRAYLLRLLRRDPWPVPRPE